jgi:hypothetical protein
LPHVIFSQSYVGREPLIESHDEDVTELAWLRVIWRQSEAPRPSIGSIRDRNVFRVGEAIDLSSAMMKSTAGCSPLRARQEPTAVARVVLFAIGR